jgi:hypothetical protein
MRAGRHGSDATSTWQRHKLITSGGLRGGEREELAGIYLHAARRIPPASDRESSQAQQSTNATAGRFAVTCNSLPEQFKPFAHKPVPVHVVVIFG